MSAPASPALERPREAWALEGAFVARALDVDPDAGLSSEEVRARSARFGPNQLQQVRPRSALLIFVEQFKSFLVALLAVAVVGSLFFAHWVEAGAIFAVIVLNGLLGFVIELRAARSVEALRRLGSARATVRRDGEQHAVPAADLVPGDIVLIEAGDVVTADLRLLESSKLEADESTFTGESVPVEKSAAPVDAGARLEERASMLFKGTAATRGSAACVVVGTGMDTELGGISRLVTDAEDESTPLEQRLNKLGQGFVWVTLALCAVVLVSGLLAGTDVILLLQTLVALAVATVPEGLPVIATVALARGVHRMAKREALVSRLSAVETLGATNVLCTNKTGTLTENRMTVREVRLGHSDDVWLLDSKTDPPGFGGGRDPQTLATALAVGALCNNASFEGDDVVGDPMEAALLVAATRANVDLAQLRRVEPEVDEVAFDPDTKMMATVHAARGAFHYAVKGAPEAIVGACPDLDGDGRRAWLTRADSMAARGLRVLALAEKREPVEDAEPYGGLSLLGLVGMMDPARATGRGVVDGCRSAGIRVVMVTGDHPKTALVIAREVGLATPADTATLGSSLGENVDDDALRHTVFARVSPAEKLALVRAHQRAGAIVAMTGDGVNDAPALKQADIGVAMGGRGTEVARQAGDLVLKDDRLETLLVAVREGRVIFDNLRNFVVYLLSCNVAEVLIIGLAAAFGAPLPLLPLQILFLNLVTDVFPALALGAGEGRRDVMARPPRDKREQILGRPQWVAIGVHGAVLTATVLGAFAYALVELELDTASAQTIAFLALGFAQLTHVVNMRAGRANALVNDVTRNRWVWGAVALSVALLVGVALFSPAARVVGVTPLAASEWGLVAALAAVPVLVGQLLLSLRWVDHTRGRPARSDGGDDVPR
jgi:Ca2+-transporting ATPase